MAGAVYVNAVIVPVTSPLFVPTHTPTRAPEIYIVDADALAQQGKFLQAIEMYKEAIQADPKNATNLCHLAKIQIYQPCNIKTLKLQC